MINYYDSIASEWDKMCEQNPEKLRCLVSLCQIPADSRILYAACATGVVTPFFLETMPKHVLGVDISAEMIRIAREKYESPALEFRCEDIMQLKNDRFDCVFLYDAFNQFENRGNITRHMHHLLSAKGRLMICHSQSRTQINAQKSARFSLPMPAARTLSTTLSQYFDVDITIDSPDFYVVSGLRHQIV